MTVLQLLRLLSYLADSGASNSTKNSTGANPLHVQPMRVSCMDFAQSESCIFEHLALLLVLIDEWNLRGFHHHQ